MFRVRLDRELIAETSRVADEMGTTPGELVRMLFKQVVKRRAVPFSIQADSPEDEILRSESARAKLWDEL